MIKNTVILAAGRGARLQPLTCDLPKPMAPLPGNPVMGNTVEHLARQNVRELMLSGANRVSPEAPAQRGCGNTRCRATGSRAAA